MTELGHRPTVYQLVYALHSHPLGRRTLVHSTGITESTVRTHLNKLRAAGLVTMAKEGTALTPKGTKAFTALLEQVLCVGQLKLSDLALDHHNEAAWIRGAGDALRESWRYRDAAVREGSTGVLLLVQRANGWSLSDDAKLLIKQNPHDASYLQKTFDAQPGDGVIIAFGPSRRIAQSGLWRVLAELFPTQTRKELQR